MTRRFGFGDYQYELVEGWPKIEIKGATADLACDSRGRVYVGVRNPKPDGSPGNILGGTGHVLVFDRDGNLVDNWGEICSSPHGVWINQQDEIFLSDTGFHTVTKHAPSGEVLLTLGTKGSPGAPGEPFNMPTKLYPHAVRGGSWEDDADRCRSAARVGSDKDWKIQDPQIPKSRWYHTDALFLGFRVVRPLVEDAAETKVKFKGTGDEEEDR